MFEDIVKTYNLAPDNYPTIPLTKEEYYCSYFQSAQIYLAILRIKYPNLLIEVPVFEFLAPLDAFLTQLLARNIHVDRLYLEDGQVKAEIHNLDSFLEPTVRGFLSNLYSKDLCLK